jgi:hypothetical protein
MRNRCEIMHDTLVIVLAYYEEVNMHIATICDVNRRDELMNMTLRTMPVSGHAKVPRYARKYYAWISDLEGYRSVALHRYLQGIQDKSLSITVDHLNGVHRDNRNCNLETVSIDDHLKRTKKAHGGPSDNLLAIVEAELSGTTVATVPERTLFDYFIS